MVVDQVHRSHSKRIDIDFPDSFKAPFIPRLFQMGASCKFSSNWKYMKDPDGNIIFGL